MGLASSERLELFRQRPHLRHEPGRRDDRPDVDLAHVAVGRANGPQQVLGVQDADDVLRLVAPQRNAGVFGRQHLAHDVLGRQVGVDQHHLGAMDHDVGDLKLAQIEQPAEHIAVELFDAAFMMDQVDRAAQPFGRR
jgi:hypothetical protein